jgi:hypothetical protein
MGEVRVMHLHLSGIPLRWFVLAAAVALIVWLSR